MANFDPDSVLTSPHPDRASMLIKGNPAVTKYLLDKVVPGESGGRWDVIYGTDRKADTTGHPGIHSPITSGPNVGKTSSAAGGLQFEVDTWNNVAKQTGLSDFSKDSQLANGVWLALDQYRKDTGRNLETDLASGSASLQEGIRRSMSTQWEALGKPGPRVDKLGPAYRFSDYATREHEGRPDTDIMEMSPEDYLDLSSPLEGKPFSNPSGRSLMKSFQRGEPIESIPTMNVNINGDAAMVTDQDGRHRALLAQQEGVPKIPVAVQKTGEGDPKEITGMNGNKKPFPGREHYEEPQPQPPKEPISLPGMIGEAASAVGHAIMPSAEAAEPDDGVKAEPPPWAVQSQQGEEPDDGVKAEPPPWAVEQPPQQPADGMLLSAAKGAAQGFGNTVLGGQELLGKGMRAVGVPGGDWLVNDARSGIQKLQGEMAPDQAAHPTATGVGEFLGGMVGPGGVGMGLAKNVLARGAIAGATSGLLQPGNPDNYWQSKVIQAGTGAGLGAVGGVAGNALSGIASGAMRPAVRYLAANGVELTPGQMKGGAAKAFEDKLMSIPITGDAIRAARTRGLEDWNRLAFNQALEPIGLRYTGEDVGHEGMAKIRGALNQNYDRVLSGTQLGLTNQYSQSLQQLKANLLNMPDGLTPDQMSQFERFIDQTVSSHWDASGRMSGETFKKVESILTNQAGNYHRSPDQMIRSFGSAIDDLNGVLRKALEDQNPGKGPELKAANRAWANYARLRKATVQRPTNATGVFTPNDLLRSSFAGDNSPGKSAFSEGRALLQDFGKMGQEVLGGGYPDSGTTGRYLAAEMVGGFLTHPGATLGALGAQAAGAIPYTPPASKAMNAALNRLATMSGPTRATVGGVGNALANVAGPAAGSWGAGAVLPQQPTDNALAGMQQGQN